MDEWLCCNHCYYIMAITEKNFSVTQCGHIFCEYCISKAQKSCFVCGTADFRSMQLTRPPKLEGVMNYFSSIQDFTQKAKKSVNFYEEQLAIALRGAQIFDKKYNSLVRFYARTKSSFREERTYYKKLLEENKKLDASLKAYEERAIDETPSEMEIDACKTQTIPQNQSVSFRLTNSSTRKLELSADSRKSSKLTRFQAFPSGGPSGKSYPWKSSDSKAPKFLAPHNPHPAFSNASYSSAASTLGSVSGCERMVVDPPVSIRHGEFLVPTIRSVPKSATKNERKARTLPRLSALRTGDEI